MIKALFDKPRAVPVLSVPDVVRDAESAMPGTSGAIAQIVRVVSPVKFWVERQPAVFVERKATFVAFIYDSGLSGVAPELFAVFIPADDAEKVVLPHDVEAVLNPGGDIAPDVLVSEDKKIRVYFPEGLGIGLNDRNTGLGLPIVEDDRNGGRRFHKFRGLVVFVGEADDDYTCRTPKPGHDVISRRTGVDSLMCDHSFFTPAA